MFLYAVRYQYFWWHLIRYADYFGNYNFSKNALFFINIEDTIIFQQEISFRTQIVDLENEDKKSA